MTTAYFEALYAADPDPWDLATSPYERDKYDATIAALDGRRYGRGLEVGCSIGTLSERLAGVCDELVPLDAAPTAVARARRRLEGRPGVTVELRRAPDELPEGPFDLIVCSEVLYYWDDELLRRGVARLLERLAPGGSFLAVHWRGPVRHYPQGGDAVHEALSSLLAGLVHARERVEPQYRLDRWDRPR
jgi:SAM-dependent methyltransferase